jgi:hypothetical protein
MQLHRNAKLGLSGRFALVRAIESGCSIREAAKDAMASRRRPPARGRGAGEKRARTSGRRSSACTTARAAGAAVRGCWHRPNRSGSAKRGAGRAGVRG